MIVLEAIIPRGNPILQKLDDISCHEQYNKFLQKYDYDEVYFDGLNRYYLRKESHELKRFFDIPVGPLFDQWVLSEDENVRKERLRLLKVNETQKEVANELESKNLSLKKDVEMLEANLIRLEKDSSRQLELEKSHLERLEEDYKERLEREKEAHKRLEEEYIERLSRERAAFKSLEEDCTQKFAQERERFKRVESNLTSQLDAERSVFKQLEVNFTRRLDEEGKTRDRLEAEIERLTQANDQLSSAGKQIDSALAITQQDHARLEGDLCKAREECAVLRDEVGQVQESRILIEAQSKEHATQAEVANSIINELKSELDTRHKDLLDLHRQNQLLKQGVTEKVFKSGKRFRNLLDRYVPFTWWTKKMSSSVQGEPSYEVRPLPAFSYEEVKKKGVYIAEAPFVVGTESWSAVVADCENSSREDAALVFEPVAERMMGLNGNAVSADEFWFGIVSTPRHLPDRVIRSLFPELPKGGDPFSGSAWRKNRHYCRGIITSCETHAAQIREQVDVPVMAVIPPLPDNRKTWTMEQYEACGQIIQPDDMFIRQNGLPMLPAAQGTKVIWRSEEGVVDELVRAEQSDLHSQRLLHDYMLDEVNTLSPPNSEARDFELSRSVVFAHYFDASIPLIILECLASGTPMIVNPIPSLVEILGAGYPLYFNSYLQAAKMLEDKKRILAAHEYLVEKSGHMRQAKPVLQDMMQVIK